MNVAGRLSAAKHCLSCTQSSDRVMGSRHLNMAITSCLSNEHSITSHVPVHRILNCSSGPLLLFPERYCQERLLSAPFESKFTLTIECSKMSVPSSQGTVLRPIFHLFSGESTP